MGTVAGGIMKVVTALVVTCQLALTMGASTSVPPVKAVPLQQEQEQDELLDDYTSSEDENTATTPIAIPDTTSPPITTPEPETSESTFITATSSTPLENGQIAWAPYNARKNKKQSRGHNNQKGPRRRPRSLDDTSRPVSPISAINLPSSLQHMPAFLLPSHKQPKGRWISKDKKTVPIVNSRPAFIFPQVPVTDHVTGRSEHVSRVKRGLGGGQGHKNPYVARCGGVFRDLYGVIQSPEYPLYYPNHKRCSYDIEVPEGHSIKLTCEKFIMQGGDNCTHDYLMVDFTGDTSYSHGTKFCGLQPPVVISNSTRMTILFKSDDLFRYQGFSCRYRALLPNGDAVPGSFGNSTDSTQSGLSSNNFMQVVQCPSNTLVNVNDPHSSMDIAKTSGNGGAASLYSGVWDGRCGTQNSLPGLPPKNRIIGGYKTTEHQFPWMAAVLRSCETEYCHICGATIISEEWILTGAHCMQNVPMEELGVLVGDHSLFTISTSQKFIKIKEKIIHPDYFMRGNVTSPLNNDIGLLRLEYPIIFTSQVSPLCLPALGETGFGGSAYSSDGNTTMLDTEGLEIVGKNATVLGWGVMNADNDYADSLRGVEVEILPNDDCHKLYGIMTENMMCTSGANAQGSCYGDSGGPAIVKQDDGSWVQVGIIAFGAQAGCDLGYPTGQTLVHKFIDWIQAITNIAFGHKLG